MAVYPLYSFSTKLYLKSTLTLISHSCQGQEFSMYYPEDCQDAEDMLQFE